MDPHNIKNWSTTLRKINSLLALTHFKSMHCSVSMPHENTKKVFWCFQVWKWNIGLKSIKVILNNFINGYLIFTSVTHKHNSIQLGYSKLWMGPEPTTFRLRGRHPNHYTIQIFKFECLSPNVNVVSSSPIHDVLIIRALFMGYHI